MRMTSESFLHLASIGLINITRNFPFAGVSKEIEDSLRAKNDASDLRCYCREEGGEARSEEDESVD